MKHSISFSKAGQACSSSRYQARERGRSLTRSTTWASLEGRMGSALASGKVRGVMASLSLLLFEWCVVAQGSGSAITVFSMAPMPSISTRTTSPTRR